MKLRPLPEIVRSRSVEELDAALAAGADPLILLDGGQTLLHLAARCANRAMAARLVSAGVDPAQRDDSGRLPDELVSVGDPSMDPEDVAELSALRRWFRALVTG